MAQLSGVHSRRPGPVRKRRKPDGSVGADSPGSVDFRWIIRPTSTEGGTRTLTTLRPLDFESNASANSATSACRLRSIQHEAGSCKPGCFGEMRVFRLPLARFNPCDEKEARFAVGGRALGAKKFSLFTGVAIVTTPTPPFSPELT